jgi:hypothetical protein
MVMIATRDSILKTVDNDPVRIGKRLHAVQHVSQLRIEYIQLLLRISLSVVTMKMLHGRASLCVVAHQPVALCYGHSP